MIRDGENTFLLQRIHLTFSNKLNEVRRMTILYKYRARVTAYFSKEEHTYAVTYPEGF